MIIKHKYSMDVCFDVYSKHDYGGSSVKLKGMWINMGFKQSYSIAKANIAIKKSDWNNWLICDGPPNKCLRYCDWRERGV